MLYNSIFPLLRFYSMLPLPDFEGDDNTGFEDIMSSKSSPGNWCNIYNSFSF